MKYFMFNCEILTIQMEYIGVKYKGKSFQLKKKSLKD